LENGHLKICHVITRMIVGGAQENTLLSVLHHIEAGHETVLVTGPSPGPEGELLKQQDLPPFEIVETPNLIRELNPVRDMLACRTLRRFFRERKFDVVHTHSSKAGVVGRAAAWAEAVPAVVHTVHGQAFHAYEKPWKNALYKASERWAAKRCHRIFAVAQAMIDQCVSARVAPPEKYQVVYSGMRLEPFLAAKRDPDLARSLGIPEKATVIGAIARLFPLKGYEYFIPATMEIVRKNPDVHVLIVGNGILMDPIRNQIQNAGLGNRFSFSGLVSPTDIPRYTGLMDMLVHLSLREGLPRTVVQALASGIPAVGFDLDGTPEVILDGKTGRLVKPEDTHGVLQAISELVEAPEKRREMGANGRELVRTRFDWRRMGEILESAYTEIMNRDRSPSPS
jgi:glycosyltransferase involved in cell wall biosynthesis